MSREVIIRIRDDIDQSDADETIAFSYRGTNYEIDLSSANAELFDKSVQQFIEVARIVTPEKVIPPTAPARSKSAKSVTREIREQRKQIREWGAAHGHEVSLDRGIIPYAVIDAFTQANPDYELLPGVATRVPPRKPQADSDEMLFTAQQAVNGEISVNQELASSGDVARHPATGKPLTKNERDTIRAWAMENAPDVNQGQLGRLKQVAIDAYFDAKETK